MRFVGIMEKVKLRDLGDIITGNTPSKKEAGYWNSNDIPFVKPDIISDAGITILCEADEHLSEQARSKARIVNKDTVLVTCIGSIGKVGIASDGEYAFNQQINAIVPNNGIYPKYLAYAILQAKPRLEAIANAPVVPIINKSQFGEFPIYIENDLTQQKKIVEKLDKLNGIINSRKAELNKLDELIKARFVEMFSDIEDTCDVGYYIKSLTAGKSLAGEAECENKVLKTGAASFDYFDSTQIKNLPLDYEPQAEHLVCPGDIIISRMNTAELTGAAAYVWAVQDKVYLPDRLWKANLKENCNPIFVWQMLIQPSTKEQIRRECSGTSGSMKNISKSGMLAIKVKRVPFDLQNQFAEFVKQVDKSKSVIQKSLEETQLLFDSLMQEYFGQ